MAECEVPVRGVGEVVTQVDGHDGIDAARVLGQEVVGDVGEGECEGLVAGLGTVRGVDWAEFVVEAAQMKELQCMACEEAVFGVGEGRVEEAFVCGGEHVHGAGVV